MPWSCIEHSILCVCEGRREGGKEGGREGKKEREREREREGEREREREGERERERVSLYYTCVAINAILRGSSTCTCIIHVHVRIIAVVTAKLGALMWIKNEQSVQATIHQRKPISYTQRQHLVRYLPTHTCIHVLYLRFAAAVHPPITAAVHPPIIII